MTHTSPTCFTVFSADIFNGNPSFALPDKFTFPFYYQPHPLCELAAEELQQHLLKQDDWYHNFGLGDDPTLIIGKMFGVLLVKNHLGELGYLSAFSGKLAEQNHLTKFVPPVFDMLASDSFFHHEQQIIINITAQLDVILQDSAYLLAKEKFEQTQAKCLAEIEDKRLQVVANRAKRKSMRDNLTVKADDTEVAALLKALAAQSIEDKLAFNQDKKDLVLAIANAKCNLDEFEERIQSLKKQRKTLSAQLQQRLFEQYQFLNGLGEKKSLAAIFSDTVMRTPPAGAGECAAPKLLHYAYANNLTPVAMAEFWWGASPKSQVRKHKQFYPACIGKCQPILNHMLQGLTVEENQLLQNAADDEHIDIVYQDDEMLIINKPPQLLSVPGKHIQDSVYTRIKAMFPHASGSLIVHRLDMSTSGLMVIALSTASHKELQKQFISRQVSKRYMALIDGVLQDDEGVITLPLAGDFYDRPRQCVCEKTGKPAYTTWRVIERQVKTQQTKVFLQPRTGRTHQLRVHCAHERGLNMPIVGDDLYGNRARRLHLHAQYLGLFHPVSNQWLEFTCDADF
ncbi:RluA family pseudouridine synthase [Paraglaciecola sp. 20A4]|uniref:RluA family pseudouridine synthase n=1 Tax=Paraglaciecola sp. 20A4 TaxID=2687288 RepID=UPI00140C7DDB|nr:RluA family pseudouridine synthase [Paraglaciecola sp. 20A4]